MSAPQQPGRQRVARPPEIAGVPTPSTWDWVRGVGWLGRAFVHEVKKRKGWARARAVAKVAVYPFGAPVVALIYPVVVRGGSRTTRHYLSPAGDARLGITAKADGWHFADHLSARPGSGQGRVLRDLIRGPLMAEADRLGVTIHMTAANERVARIYTRELPGLVDVGRGVPRGRRLERRPGPAASVPTGPANTTVSTSQTSGPTTQPETDLARIRRLHAVSFPHPPQAALTHPQTQPIAGQNDLDLQPAAEHLRSGNGKGIGR